MDCFKLVVLTTLSPTRLDTKISGKLRVDMDTLIKDAKSQNLYQENSVEEYRF